MHFRCFSLHWHLGWFSLLVAMSIIRKEVWNGCKWLRHVQLFIVFKASALWADAFYKAKWPSVCLWVCRSVCLCVCSLLRYRLNVFLPPLPEVGCPIFFRDSESLGKSNGKKLSNICTFLFKNCLKSLHKKIFFFADFALQNMVEPLVEGRIANFGISIDVVEFLRFGWFFAFFKKILFLRILGPPGNHTSRWIRDLWSKGVSLILAYL